MFDRIRQFFAGWLRRIANALKRGGGGGEEIKPTQQFKRGGGGGEE